MCDRHPGGRADAHRDHAPRDRCGVDDGQHLDRPPHPLRQKPSGPRIGLGQHGHELLAAVAGQQLTRSAEELGQSRRHQA